MQALGRMRSGAPEYSRDRGGGQCSCSFAPDSVYRFVEPMEKAGAVPFVKRGEALP